MSLTTITKLLENHGATPSFIFVVVVVAAFFVTIVPIPFLAKFIRQIIKDRENNISYLIGRIEGKINDKNTISSQVYFRKALGITPSKEEMYFIAGNIKDLKDLYLFKRIYNFATFENNEFFVKKRVIFNEFVCDAIYYIFSGLFMGSFLLLMISLSEKIMLLYIPFFGLIISAFYMYVFLNVSGVEYAKKDLIEKK